MEFDTTVTGGIFVLIIAVAVGGLIGSNVMPTNTILMMVLPSMLAFGLICLGIGVKHGEHRAGSSGRL
ncbi:hypothetical protein DP107_15585 [Haloglomus irregulare]|jgi:ABC-type multidrug transport system permease subunit|uniref:Uncharacterized protein n=1 Tax=Haloglomus irregulare TaxID=2234134 RepID=A0A554MWP9_9EURY|nr:hypothetical protein [Haloglomus irregulare]TSD09559.1 hypothetical protein DP107_15585 [Haloglomus irregulare]